MGAAAAGSASVAPLVDGAPASAVPIDDRGLAYGDGLFETIAVTGGAPLALTAHLDRLLADAERLGLAAPERAVLEGEAIEQARRAGRGVLKILVTRGSGGRGYRPSAAPAARRIVSVHPWPDALEDCAEDGLRAFLCRHPVSVNPRLAGIKHLNRLDQVLASNEWPSAAHFEGLMSDPDGRLVEGTRSNLFLRRGPRLTTPALDRAGIRGVVRGAVLDAARRLGLSVHEADLMPAALAHADEIFVTSSVIGLRGIGAIDGVDTQLTTPGETACELRAGLRDAGLIP
ncbi:MAG: aminodeoxychorismate lyase [Gammaproteobacteria bacterium]